MTRWLKKKPSWLGGLALCDWLPFRRLSGSDPSNTPAIFRFDDDLVAKRVARERVRVFADRAFFGALTAPLGTVLLAWIGGSVAGWLHAVL